MVLVGMAGSELVAVVGMAWKIASLGLPKHDSDGLTGETFGILGEFVVSGHPEAPLRIKRSRRPPGSESPA